MNLPVSVQNGGTGATTAAQAAKNLGVLPLGEVVTKIPSGADLNDYVLPGVYAIGDNSTAATIANMPSQSAGTLRVFASTGAAITASSTWKYLIQEYITYTGARYQRYGESGSGTAVTWDTWKTIYTSADFQSGANYCRLPDGTMFQWGAQALNGSSPLTQAASSGVYFGTFTLSLPQAFVNNEFRISATTRYHTGHAVPAGVIPSSTSTFWVCVYDFWPRPTNEGNFYIYWQAVGRWK